MDLIQSLLNLVVPPAGIVFLLFSYPVFCFFSFWRWLLGHVFEENVDGKVVVITGASSGIGEAMAYEYGKLGARLVLVGRREERLMNVAERARACGATDAHPIVADLAREEDCKRYVEEAMNTFGRIDHLVVNHGISNAFFVEDARSVDLFQKIMNTNFYGSVFSAHYALNHLRKSRGKIVVTASTAAWLPVPRMSVYNASKAAMINFFDTLRTELGSELGGLTIAMPGYIQSEMTMGKFLSADGRADMDVDLRDTLIGPSPVTSTQYCASAIVSAALRGERYIVVPSWYKISLLFRLFIPQVLEVLIRLLFLRELQPGKTATKVIMDSVPVLERVMYPSGMQQKTEAKAE